jgi:hypothetical protein
MAADPTYQPKVHRRQGGNTLVVASGGVIDVEPGGSINFSSGSLTLPPNLKRGFIPLDILAARAQSSSGEMLGASVSATGGNLVNAIGGLLNLNSTPILNFNSSLNRSPTLTWASGVVTPITFPPIPIPPDFSSAGGLSIHAMAERASDNASNNVLDFRFWANQNTSEKGTTGTTMTTTPAEYSITVSSAEVGSHPGTWAVGLVPGTHTNNAVFVFGAWIEYERATS